MTPFEEIVRVFMGIARQHAKAIERALWLALAVMLAAMFAAGLAQTLK